VAETEADLAATRSRIAALEAATGGADDGLARAARARGATLLGEGLEVDPKFRQAVSAALGAAASAYLVNQDAVPALAGRRGTLAVSVARAKSAGTAAEAAISAARAAGGGPLADGIRRDPQNEVSRLLERVVWVPDLAAALSVRGLLPTGWRAVALTGEVISDDGIVALSSGESVLERRAERDALVRQAAELEQRLVEERAALDAARAAAEKTGTAAQEATRAHDSARHEQRRLDEQERTTQRRAEQLLREHDWESAQVERLSTDLAGVESLVAQLSADVDRLQPAASAQVGKQQQQAADAARRAELRGRRDELRRSRDQQLAQIRAAEDVRRTAEIRRGIDETRLRELESQIASSSDRGLGLARQRDELGRRVAAVEAAVTTAGQALDALLNAGADERARLVAAERAAVDARERLRLAESASRDGEMSAMQARLQLEQTREQLLVELATIGADGSRVLRAAAGWPQDAISAEGADEANAAQEIETLLAQVVATWQSDRGADEQAPSSGRLASLRRRFNELGAGNPFAVEEYAELRERLETLEAQRVDMENAIANTRELIASLSTLINDQFRSTFAALEGAFERRFHELFGGGDAELSLTQPDDLSATGIEIHARPPGKKRQPLSMLSGGERALTAVSLLLAMLEVRPVPFCVLDEVDAALDEANVGRFSKALRGLSDQTQFIVITHNRGTIEGADALYGVTLGDDAVSRVVSLRLPSAASNGNGHGAEIDDELAEAALA
jgi:chromosome segregation protein